MCPRQRTFLQKFVFPERENAFQKGRYRKFALMHMVHKVPDQNCGLTVGMHVFKHVFIKSAKKKNLQYRFQKKAQKNVIHLAPQKNAIYGALKAPHPLRAKVDKL